MVISRSYCIILFVSCQRGVSRVWSSATVTALPCLFHVKEVSQGYGPQPQILHHVKEVSVGYGPQPQLLHHVKEVSVGYGPQPQLLHHVKEVSVGYGPQPQLMHNLVCFMSKTCQYGMILSHSYCIILFVSCQRGVSRIWSSATVTASCQRGVSKV